MAKFRFRLKAGQHIQTDPGAPKVKYTTATGAVIERHPPKTFAVGDVIESDTNLAERFGAEKFELLSGDGGGFGAPAKATAPPPAPFPLDKMSVQQLLSVAQEEEVDVKGTAKREDLVKLLRAAGVPG